MLKPPALILSSKLNYIDRYYLVFYRSINETILHTNFPRTISSKEYLAKTYL